MKACITTHRCLCFLLSLALLAAQPARCEDSGEPPAGSGTATEPLDLFDSDTEDTRQGWPQLWISGGIMNLDGQSIDD